MAATSSRTDKYYSIDYFNKLEFDGFDYTINDKAIHTINKISKLVGAPTYKKTPIFKKYNRNIQQSKNPRQHRQDTSSNDEWETLRSFKTTKIIKNEEGINKEINIIRGYLNKLSTDTYTDLTEDINEKIESLIKVATKKDLLKLGSYIFETGAKNRFYSQLYAKLYKELMDTFTIMHEVFQDNYTKFSTIFNNIESCDNNDYINLCRINKDNEDRRAMAAFFVNLMKCDIIRITDMMDILRKFTTLLFTSMKIEGNKSICEEICDILYIVIKIGIDYFKKDESFVDVWSKFVQYSKFNRKEHPSLTNKSIFKMMDLVEEFTEMM
jgi:hypothetical protein